MVENLFAVVTNGRETGVILAWCEPEMNVTHPVWWTARAASRVSLMPRGDADEIAGKLRFNSPRVVRAEKAIKRILKQSRER